MENGHAYNIFVFWATYVALYDSYNVMILFES